MNALCRAYRNQLFTCPLRPDTSDFSKQALSDILFVRNDQRVVNFFQLAHAANQTQDSSRMSSLTNCSTIDFAAMLLLLADLHVLEGALVLVMCPWTVVRMPGHHNVQAQTCEVPCTPTPFPRALDDDDLHSRHVDEMKIHSYISQHLEFFFCIFFSFFFILFLPLLSSSSSTPFYSLSSPVFRHQREYC